MNLKRFSIYIFLLLIYFFMLFKDGRLYSLASFFLCLYSMLSLEIALQDIKKYKFNSFNLFILVFYFALLMNSFAFVNIQSEKNWIDVYYFLFVPLITSIFLYYIEHVKIKIVNLKVPKFDANKIVLLLFGIFVFLKIYIYMKASIKLLDFMNGKFFLEKDAYVVPTVTGLSNVLQWLLVISLFYISSKLRVIILFFLIIVAILNVKRGDIIREIIYIIIMYAYINNHRFNKAFFRKFLLLFLSLIFIFTVFGQLRQEFRSNNFNINTQIEGKLNNTAFNWIYGYVALNFDVAKKYIADEREKKMFPFIVLQPVCNLIGFKQDIVNYYNDIWNYRLNGFNAAPYFSTFIHDMGMLYFVEGFVYSLILAYLIYLAKKFKSEGTYIYILMLLSFSFFGAYVFNPQMFYTIIIGLIYTNFIKQRRNFRSV